MPWVVLACFFVSGASGLVFEEVWTRELTLVFGSTTLALSTVLSVFMGGLALGSRLGGRIADRLRDRLGAYAAAEAGIGLYALGVPLLLRLYPALNAALYRLLGDHPVGLSAGRFAAAALLLLIPTTLMGATLPILSRHFVPAVGRRAEIGATVGRLYALNTFGAVVGTFLGGFVLLPRVGVAITNYSAGAANLLLALFVLATRNRGAKPLDLALAASLAEAQLELELELGLEPDPEPSEPAEAATFSASTGQRRLALFAFAISGGVAMLYQVLWTRALAIVLGSSIYSFTLILLAFLVGLGLGTALLSRLAARTARPMDWLGGVHLAVAAMIGASYLVID